MKKLLTIMVLALALCLLCGAALADGDPAEFIYSGPYPTAGCYVELDMNGNGAKCKYYLQTSLTGVTCGDTKTLEFKTTDWDENDTVVFTRYYFAHGDGTTNRVHKANGTTTYKCDHCGQTITIAAADVPYGDHKDWTWEVFVDPTCTTKGQSHRVCGVCGFVDPNYEVSETSTIAHKPHIVFDEYATCIEPTAGIAHFECEFCDCYVNGAGIKQTLPVYLPVNTLGGFKYYYEQEYGVAYDEHEYGAFSLRHAATCDADSVWIKSCALCNTSVEKTYYQINWAHDNLGSDYALATTVRDDSCWKVKATFTCTNCNGNICGDITATFQDGVPQTISVEGGKYIYKANSTDKFNTEAKAKEYTGLNSGVNVKMELHSFKVDPAYLIDEIPASCLTAGYKVYKCVFCDAEAKHFDGAETYTVGGKNYTKSGLYFQKTAEQLPHKWSGYVVEIEPDIDTGVYGKWVRTCDVCHTTDNFVSFLPPADLCNGNHTPVLDEIFSFEPDCLLPGYNFYYCSVCGIDLDDLTEEVPALGHDWDVTVKKAATCTEEGLNNRICKRCHVAEMDVPVAKLAHDWDDGVITKEATLTEKGIKTYTCKNCPETKTEEVDFVPASTPKYDMTATYDGKTVSGKLVLDPTTKPADTKFIRVTFYVEGNYYMATMAEVDAAGNFTVDGVGPIVYITVAASTNSAVNPDAYEAIATPIEIEVK